MKPFLSILFLLVSFSSFSQRYAKDESEAYAAIKNYAFRRDYLYDVAFKNKSDVAFFVKSNTDYLVYCVYDNLKKARGKSHRISYDFGK